MSDVFGAGYAAAYDAVYGEKDYESECDLLERVFAEDAGRAVADVLDLGCGTGGHAAPLAARGYRVVGVDRSPAMLARARERAAALAEPPVFVEGDVRRLALDDEFDAAVLMFAVLSYQLGNDDVLATLRSARAHLREGGLLVFDVWFGPAVVHLGPSRRESVVSLPGGDVRRVSSGELDVRHDRCTVTIELSPLDGPGEPLVERHAVRYFFPSELELLLGLAGFALVRLAAFPELGREPGLDTWNVLASARAV